MGGSGDLFSSLFGGGAPEYETPRVDPAPTRDTAEPEAAAVRDAEQRKNRARAGGVRSTLLSSRLGVNNSGASAPGLLGRNL